MKYKNSHRKMLIDIINKEYINCEKIIIVDGKRHEGILVDDKSISGKRIKLFLMPTDTDRYIKFIIDNDNCDHVREFISNFSHNDQSLDNFLRFNFMIHNDDLSVTLVKEYIKKISYFIKDFNYNNRIDNITHEGHLNKVEYKIMIWKVRKLINVNEIQVEYNIHVSIKNKNDKYGDYSNEIFGISIENGKIVEDFKNNIKFPNLTIDTLAFKTFFALNPKIDNFENIDLNGESILFKEEFCKSMLLLNDMIEI